MKASNVRVNADATKVARSKPPVTATNRLHFDAEDLALVRELAQYAAESMQAVIDWELASGRGRPIVDAMRAYVRDAKALLARLT